MGNPAASYVTMKIVLAFCLECHEPPHTVTMGGGQHLFMSLRTLLVVAPPTSWKAVGLAVCVGDVAVGAANTLLWQQRPPRTHLRFDMDPNGCRPLCYSQASESCLLHKLRANRGIRFIRVQVKNAKDQ